MAALERHCARSRSWGFSPAAGTAPAPGRTLSASGLMDPSLRTFVASIEPTDFADGVMALAPSANTVQVSAESVQDLRLHRACSHRVPSRPERVPGAIRDAPSRAGVFPGSTTEFVVPARRSLGERKRALRRCIKSDAS